MLKRSLVYALCFALLNLGSPLVAHAELVGTLQAADTATRDSDLGTVNAAMARDEVRARMVAFGVDPAEVEARVARLSDTELHTLATRIEGLPAGGDALAVIGIVFVVLLILEFTGVIDIFKKA